MDLPSEHVTVNFGSLPRDFLPTVIAKATAEGWRDGLGANGFTIAPGRGTTLTIFADQAFLSSLVDRDISTEVKRLNALQSDGCDVRIVSPDGTALDPTGVPRSLVGFVRNPEKELAAASVGAGARRISKLLLTVRCPSTVRKFLLAGLHHLHPGGNHL